MAQYASSDFLERCWVTNEAQQLPPGAAEPPTANQPAAQQTSGTSLGFNHTQTLSYWFSPRKKQVNPRLRTRPLNSLVILHLVSEITFSSFLDKLRPRALRRYA